MEVIIFDIDGVLADAKWRVDKYITPARKAKTPIDWNSFFEDQALDEPIEPTVKALAQLSGRYPAIFFTGRPESTRAATSRWLMRHGCAIDVVPPYAALTADSSDSPLWMRPDGDRTDDHILKIRMLNQARELGYKPIMAFEDRARIVAAYRANGLVVAHMDTGNF